MKLVALIFALLSLASCSFDFKKDETLEKEEEVSSGSSYQQQAQFSKDDWRLILVNAENPIPDDFTVEFDSVQGYKVDKRIKEPLENMINAAKSEGIDLLICYGYRTYEQSKALFEKQINYQLSRGLAYEEAVREAAKWVAPPGTSEHHTALAVDIVTPSNQVLDHEFKNTDAACWMKDNAYKYGFILRYPEDKQEITGITFEPWHYRFVGNEAAEYMYQNDICLEEFLKGENVR